MNEKLKEIKEALSKATQEGSLYVDEAQFLNNAPTYIRYILDELEKAQKENEEKDEAILYAMEQIQIKGLWIRKIESEHVAMKEALEWYADGCNWGSIEEYGAWVSDGGERAKVTLSTIQRPTEQPRHESEDDAE